MSEQASGLLHRSSERSARLAAAGLEHWRNPRHRNIRGPLALLALGLVLSWFYHLSLPPWRQFEGFGIYLMGPYPAALGAPIGLFLHQRAPRFLQILGAAAFAFLACLVVLILPGVFVFGPVGMVIGFYRTFTVALFDPFGALQYLTYPPLFAAGLWSNLKIVLTWAGLFYGLLLAWRYDAWRRAKPLVQGIGLGWSFSRHQRRLRRAWQREYMLAQRAGVAPPPPPPELAVAGGSGHHLTQHAHTALLVVRIGVFAAGALGFWAAFDEPIKAIVKQVIFGILTGG